jgi:hypothetical protein
MDTPPQLGTAAQVGLALVIVLLLGLLAVLLVRSNRKRAEHDAALVSTIERCFTELARRRGLTLERSLAHQHPVVGDIPMPPRVTGALDGFRITLSIEGDQALDGNELTVLRIGARPGSPDWVAQIDPCRTSDAIPVAARESLARLCGASNRVELEPRMLIVEPKVPSKTDWHGRTRRIETDVDRLDAWLELALAFARSLG